MNIDSQWLETIRRELHRIPEPSFREEKTSRFVAERLDEMGIPWTRAAGTGIVARCGQGPPCVAIRADMDALPLEEKTGMPFSSSHPGMMHACGHDGHMAMVLGAARMLSAAEPEGEVRFLFQPAEESGGGAKAMIEEGCLDGVDVIFGGHIDRNFHVGEIAVNTGLITAYADGFEVDIWGKGGHAARPHEGVDAIVVASLLVISIQTLITREVDPAYPSIVSVGTINGGDAPNVIADHVRLEGTIRTTHPEVRSRILRGLGRMVSSMEELYGARTSYAITGRYPPVVNDKWAAGLAREAAAKVVGEERVTAQRHPSLGGEDFSFYLHKIPGCFVRFGGFKEGCGEAPAHSSRFDFDERVLPLGARFFAEAALLSIARLGGGSG